MDPKTPEESPQQTLKRIQKQSQSQKRQKTFNILNRKPSSSSTAQSYQFNNIKTGLTAQWNRLYRKMIHPENKKMIMMTAFLIFSSYICWKVESKYDIMRQKATRTRSFKQKQIEEENERIQKYLQKNQFQSVPIQDEVEPGQKYKFEEDSEDLSVFDTKDYLYEQIASEYRHGQQIDIKIEEELRKRGLI